MKIYKILENFYYGGSIDYPDEEDGIPFGYTRIAPENLDLADGVYLKWYGGSSWIETNDVPPPIPKPPRLVSKLNFLTLLGDTEYVAILTAAKTDAAVEAWKDKFSLMSEIDLNDTKTEGFLAMFVSKGLITQEKANIILE